MAGTVTRSSSLVTALLLALYGCAREDAATGNTGLSLGALENAEYLSEWVDGGRVQLEDGEYRHPETHLRIRLLTHAAGDLNGDGQGDAAVVLITDPGGSGEFCDLAAVLNVDGEPRNVASHPLGDRVRLDSIAVVAGQVNLTMVTHGPNDPMCCPTLAVTATYELRQGALAEVSRKPLAGELPEGSGLPVAGEFKALGNEPFWNVEISASGIVFELMGESALDFPYYPAVRSDARRVYSSRTAHHSIEITIERASCADNMSGARFDYAATVRIDGAEYRGCAKAGLGG
jgi:uncharacterized membrane protein